MQYDNSLLISDQSNCKEDTVLDTEDEDSVSEPSAIELAWRGIMSQRDMEKLTSWFPKSAQTLARVLRTRAQQLEINQKILSKPNPTEAHAG